MFALQHQLSDEEELIAVRRVELERDLESMNLFINSPTDYQKQKEDEIERLTQILTEELRKYKTHERDRQRYIDDGLIVYTEN
jgi:hypothetical protein